MKNFTKSLIGLSFLLATMSLQSYANNCQVLSLTKAAPNVTFTLSWENSWRANTTPFNWDAVWVFVKWRTCGASDTAQWKHASISTNVSDHILGAFEPTTTTVEPDPTTNAIDPSPYNNGIMLRRNAAGVYSNADPAATANANNTITLKTVAPNALPAGMVDLKVFAIEMVFIPTGAYNFGDNNSQFHWDAGQGFTSEAAKTITCGNAFSTEHFLDWGTGNANWNMNMPSTANVQLPAAYPKGYNSMYCMKYEISQDQWARFLNTIPNMAATYQFDVMDRDGKWTGNYPFPYWFRNRTSNTGTYPNVYVSDRPNRAQGFLYYLNTLAYLDWACLRPMTELDFEKICRGQGSVMDQEYAWGNTTVVAANTMSTTVPSENGTEFIVAPAGANCNYGNTAIGGGDPGSMTGPTNATTVGPLRVGIFARPLSNDRPSTGATYWGVMEMSGNVWEMVINTLDLNTCGTVINGWTCPACPPGTYRGVNFTKMWGDGYINPINGVHNVAAWPQNLLPLGNGWDPVGYKGGGFYDAWNYLRVSERWCVAYGADCPSYWNRGGRGLR